MRVQPVTNNFTSAAELANDPYNTQFSKTDASAMSNAIKNGSLDFGDLKSSTGFNADSPAMKSESDKAKVTSPRSPVGRTDKRRDKEFVDAIQQKKKSPVKDVKKEKLKEQKPKEIVPQFYFPKGKPISKQAKEATELNIQKAFEGKPELKIGDFDFLTMEVCQLPKICNKQLFERIKHVEKLDEKTEAIPKQTFINYWKK